MIFLRRSSRFFEKKPLSLAALDSSPERGSPWQNRQVSSSPVNGRKKPTGKQCALRLCQGRPLRGSWHSQQAVTEGVLPISPLSRQSTERVSPKTTLHTKMTRADTRAIQIFSAGAADLTSAGHSPVSGCCSSQIHSRILSGRFVTMASGPKGSSERSTLRVSTVQNATLTPSA